MSQGLQRTSAALFLCLLAPTLSMGQSDGPVAVTQDPAGDAKYLLASTGSAPLVTSIYGPDLRTLELEETPSEFIFTVTMEPRHANAVTSVNALDVRFRHGTQEYVLDMAEHNAEVEGKDAALYQVDSLTGATTLVAALDLEGDTTAGDPLVTHVPRNLLRDELGAPPFQGRLLEGFHVYADGGGMAVNEYDFYEWDRMPDEGVSDTVWEVKYGIDQSGDVRLWSPSPARSSNGAATTYVFPVAAVHEGEKESTYAFTVESAPSGWEVHLPTSQITFSPDEVYRSTVLVTVPFAHKHGGIETVTLALDDGNSRSTVGLEVRFHSIPQPAGHHQTLYLHMRPGEAFAPAVIPPTGVFHYMNTLDNDPEDGKQGVHGQPRSVPNDPYLWDIALHPSLDMGLDFDTTKQGTLTIPVSVQTPTPGAVVFGTLDVLMPSGDHIRLADLPATDPIDLMPGAETDVELDVIPTDESDFIEYQGPAFMALHLSLDPGRPTALTSPEAPMIMPGGWMRLPLQEYEDPIDPEFLTAAEISLTGPETIHLALGQEATTTVTLISHATETRTYRIDVAGIPSDWVAIDPEQLDLDPGKKSTTDIQIIVPLDADEGTKQILVRASNMDGGATAIRHIEATVHPAGTQVQDPSSNGADDAGSVQTPSIGLLVSMIVILAMAIAKRRDH